MSPNALKSREADDCNVCLQGPSAWARIILLLTCQLMSCEQAPSVVSDAAQPHRRSLQTALPWLRHAPKLAAVKTHGCDFCLLCPSTEHALQTQIVKVAVLLVWKAHTFLQQPQPAHQMLNFAVCYPAPPQLPHHRTNRLVQHHPARQHPAAPPHRSPPASDTDNWSSINSQLSKSSGTAGSMSRGNHS